MPKIQPTGHISAFQHLQPKIIIKVLIEIINLSTTCWSKLQVWLCWKAESEGEGLSSICHSERGRPMQCAVDKIYVFSLIIIKIYV
jgi:hypothetical protein